MNSKYFLALFCCFLNANSSVVLADSGSPLTSEGVAGYADKGRRNPVVSVSVERGDKRVTLLADAYVPNTEFAEYPIQFDFFVNRKLFATQIRSKALPGPIGVDIGTDVASPPFNYTVVGKVLHPNREFTTVLEGAVYATNLTAVLDCTLTLPASGNNSEESDIFTESEISSAQTSSNQLSVALSKAERDDSAETVSASASITLTSGDAVAGTLSYTRSGETRTVATEGSVTLSDGRLSELSVHNADSSVELTCS